FYGCPIGPLGEPLLLFPLGEDEEVKGFLSPLACQSFCDGKRPLVLDFSHPRLPKTPPSQPAAIIRTKITSATRSIVALPKGRRMRAATKPTRKPCSGAALSTLRPTQTAA